MKGMIRSKITRQYFAGKDRWTYDPEEAAGFESIEQLLREASEEQRKAPCSIVLQFGEGRPDVELPIR